MIRPVQPKDAPFIEAFAPDANRFNGSFLYGMVACDENDVPVAFAGSWVLPEVHCDTDPQWKTPEDRWAAIVSLHAAMESQLKANGFRVAVSFFPKQVPLWRRLFRLGWQKSDRISLIKVIHA